MNDVKQEINELRSQINQLNTGITAAMAVSDHRNRTKNIIIGILAALFIGSNVGWMMFEKSMETVEETTTTETTTETYTIDQDNENGDNNYIGKDGNITYGEAKNNGN